MLTVKNSIHPALSQDNAAPLLGATYNPLILFDYFTATTILPWSPTGSGGADSLNRTDDLPLTRRLLYQLSYAGGWRII